MKTFEKSDTIPQNQKRNPQMFEVGNRYTFLNGSESFDFTILYETIEKKKSFVIAATSLSGSGKRNFGVFKVTEKTLINSWKKIRFKNSLKHLKSFRRFGVEND